MSTRVYGHWGCRLRSAALLRASVSRPTDRSRAACVLQRSVMSSGNSLSTTSISRGYISLVAKSSEGLGKESRPLYRVPVRPFSAYPAHQVVGLPALSPTMEVGTIATWVKKEGEAFGPGDVLCEVETDKATVSFDAQDEGVLAKILVQAGTEVKVGEAIMVVVEDAGSVAAFANFSAPSSGASAAASAPAPASPPAPSPTPAPTPAAPTPAPSAPVAPAHHNLGRVFASPLAKTLASQKGFDIRSVTGTGPNGRVIAADVREFVPSLTVQPSARSSTASSSAVMSIPGVGYTDFPLSESSKAIAARLTHAKQVVPHYYLTVDLSLSKLLGLRDTLNGPPPKGPTREGDTVDERISVNDLLLKAAALACVQVPDANASWHGDFVRHYHSVDINLTVGLGDGLLAPVLRSVEGKGIKALSQEVRGLVHGARQGSLSPDSLSTGTFSIVNVGGYGVRSVAPIVNTPQACVLGVGAIENRVLPRPNGKGVDDYEVVPGVTVTLSCDHRVIDGAVGAQWLSVFKNLVEDPVTLLL